MRVTPIKIWSISNAWDEMDSPLVGSTGLHDPNDLPGSGWLDHAARHGTAGTTARRHGG
jgi:hypothetical protein